jgi:carbamate kinase
MNHPATERRRAVVALGGNALLRRGEPLEAANQARAARDAARALAPASLRHQLVITHGNGPQVGLLALMSDAYTETAPYPLDVLDAETAGQIGYVLEMQLDNFIDHQETVTVITRIMVDADDPAFESPSKFIGPVYTEDRACELADRYGWTVRPDGAPTRGAPPGAASLWRRVVPSPAPRRIVQLGAIERLVDAGFLVVCAGGGGVPVVEDEDGRHRGVEAVIDKDLASCLVAIELGVDTLVLATDVDAVYDGYGGSESLAIAHATPAALRQRDFPAGSMGPKVEAACRFVERTGGTAAIGSLDEVQELLDGRAGTQVSADGPKFEYRDRAQERERVA